MSINNPNLEYCRGYEASHKSTSLGNGENHIDFSVCPKQCEVLG